MKRQKLMIKYFMELKNEWSMNKYLQRYKVDRMQNKINDRIVRVAIKGLKWLMFYKKTKRAYLKYKKEKF